MCQSKSNLYERRFAVNFIFHKNSISSRNPESIQSILYIEWVIFVGNKMNNCQMQTHVLTLNFDSPECNELRACYHLMLSSLF